MRQTIKRRDTIPFFRTWKIAGGVFCILVLGLAAGISVAQKNWGIQGTYYTNPEWKGAPHFIRKDHGPSLKGETVYDALSTRRFSVRWEGWLVIDKPGVYMFATTSDDGSVLWIDGRHVVDNGGSHGKKRASGEIPLEAGSHHIEVLFFSGGGYSFIRSFWTPPGQKEALIPFAQLFVKPPSTLDIWLRKGFLQLPAILKTLGGIAGVLLVVLFPLLLSMNVISLSRKRCRALLILLIVLAAARIMSTYSVFSRTSDEGAHLAAGMEWLDQGRYTYEYKHTPLARVITALGPYFKGFRSTGNPDLREEGDAIIYRDGIPSHSLMCARSGTLLFFVITAVLVYVWSRRLFSEIAAFTAVIVFSALPPILAHSGVATTDMGFTAMFTLALYAFTIWLERLSWGHSLLLGIGIGLVVLAKLSGLLFFPACGLAIVTLHAGFRWRGIVQMTQLRNLMKHGMLIGLAIFLVLWGGYRFSLKSLAEAEEWSQVKAAQAIPTQSSLYHVYQTIQYVPLPLSELIFGIVQLLQHGQAGHDSYLLGENRETGWWYFFPVALAVKTPIAFLLLAALGSSIAFRQMLRERCWRAGVPIACAVMILLVVLPSKINIGIRHILPIYVFLSMLAGCGAVWLLRIASLRMAGRTAAILLLGWHVVGGLSSHPDYLAYFNEFAGTHPERILINSDLDWGQDAYRLRRMLQEADFQQLSVAIRYHATALFRVNPAIEVRTLHPYQHAAGWIAISAGTLYRREGYEWLHQYTPAMKVGQSIYLYYLPENTLPASL